MDSIEVIATILHSLQGGEDLWRIHAISPEQCDRCRTIASSILDELNQQPKEN